MDDINTTNEETAATATVVPLSNAEGRRIAANTKPKTVKRSLEELDKLMPGKMTDLEKNDYIKELREQLTKLAYQIQALDNNAKSAYEQARMLQARYDDLKVKASAKINYARQLIDVARTSIILAGGLDIND
jgi:peptidoglycan hydrolase CwlO-like protein